MIRRNGHWIWDLDRLFEQVLAGLREATQRGIDTWSDAYVLIDREGKRI